MNPENPDSNKINNCDWVFIDAIGLRAGRIQETLRQTVKLMDQHANVALLSVTGVNEMTAKDAQKVIR